MEKQLSTNYHAAAATTAAAMIFYYCFVHSQPTPMRRRESPMSLDRGYIFFYSQIKVVFNCKCVSFSLLLFIFIFRCFAYGIKDIKYVY